MNDQVSENTKLYALYLIKITNTVKITDLLIHIICFAFVINNELSIYSEEIERFIKWVSSR